MNKNNNCSMENMLIKAYEELLKNKREYFLYFVNEQVSYESWLTIELLMHFRKLGYEVKVTPKCRVIKENEIENDKINYLDLFISNGVESCVIELKIALATTQGKYYRDCADDIIKLQNLNDLSVKSTNFDINKIKKLFILIVISKRIECEYKDNWNPWLDKIFKKSGEKAESLIGFSEFTDIDNQGLTFVAYHKNVTHNSITEKLHKVVDAHSEAFSILAKN